MIYRVRMTFLAALRSTTVRNFLTYSIGSVAMRVVTAISALLMIRVLTPNEFGLLSLVNNFTILFPERKGELGILSKWDKYLAYAHENKNRAQYNYLLPALHSLQILKSKETRFTEDGLKIIMPEPKEFDMAEQELPETRKF